MIGQLLLTFYAFDNQCGKCWKSDYMLLGNYAQKEISLLFVGWIGFTTVYAVFFYLISIIYIKSIQYVKSIIWFL